MLPAVFGLDSAGVVTAVGDQVRGVRVGVRVHVDPGLSCGSCRACRRGEEPELPRLHVHGLLRVRPRRPETLRRLPYGGLAEYLTAPERNLVVLLDSVTFSRPPASPTSARPSPRCAKPAPAPAAPCSSTASPEPRLGLCLIALGLGVAKVLGTGRNPDLLDDVKAIAPDRIDVLPAGTAALPGWVRDHTGGEGVDIVTDALGPGARPRPCWRPSQRSPAAGSWSTSAACWNDRSRPVSMMCWPVRGDMWPRRLHSSRGYTRLPGALTSKASRDRPSPDRSRRHDGAQW